MAYVRRRGNQLAIVQGEREPGTGKVQQRILFTLYSKAEVLEAAAQPINRRSTPEEQAVALVFLNSPAASYLNGVVLPVDGGLMGGIATGQIDPRSLMGPAS